METSVHTIPELMMAAATRLGTTNLNDLGNNLGLRETSSTLAKWIGGRQVPREKYCLPIAQALGVDADYVMACMVVARRRSLDLAEWRKRASREFHPAAIDTVNALLGKAAATYERDGRTQLLLARAIRTRAHSIQACASQSSGQRDGLHTVPDLIYALAAKFREESDESLARALGASTGRVGYWRRGEKVPCEKHGVSLAHALGIDPQYALACLAQARGGGARARARQDGHGHYGSSIRTLNSLLEKSATHYENEARLQLQRVERLRARLRDG